MSNKTSNKCTVVETHSGTWSGSRLISWALWDPVTYEYAHDEGWSKMSLQGKIKHLIHTHIAFLPPVVGGDVFSHVCLPFCLSTAGESTCDHYPWCHWSVTSHMGPTLRHFQTCSFWDHPHSCHQTPSLPSSFWDPQPCPSLPHVQTSSLGPHYTGPLTPWTCPNLFPMKPWLLGNERLAFDGNTFFWIIVFTHIAIRNNQCKKYVQWTWLTWLSCKMSLVNVIPNYNFSILRAAELNPLIQQCQIVWSLWAT